MSTDKIDGLLFKEMLLTGNHLLQASKHEVDALNVFPVPDGDTGTNMSLTLKAAVNEMLSHESSDLEKIAQSVSMGALMGARGNSGVILSQLIRGFAKKAEGKNELTVNDFINCLQGGVETAYKAVMKPVEGTILTVAKEAVLGSKKLSNPNIEDLLKEVVKAGTLALAKTPEQLPVLKQAGVVDAGGKGWLLILEGWLLAVQGKGIKEDSNTLSQESNQKNLKLGQGQGQVVSLQQDIEFRYCTEFIINGNNIPEDKLKEQLLPLGDCLLAVGTPQVIKVHIHSNNPGTVLEIGLNYGILNQIKIENMEEQHKETLLTENISQLPPNQLIAKDGLIGEERLGVIAIVMGEGIEEIFSSLGVDVIISGGQTMNPSIGDIIEGIKQINAKEIIILPNNSNIILTAQQTKSLVDKEIKVIPTKTIPQGISAMMAFDRENTLEENYDNMLEMSSGVITGEITYAVRESQYADWQIKAGDILGLIDDQITIVGSNPEAVLIQLIQDNIHDQQLVTIYYGQEVHEEVAFSVAKEIQEKFPSIELELHSGKQPLYYYIFSIE